jgi:hypothetical protein
MIDGRFLGSCLLRFLGAASENDEGDPMGRPREKLLCKLEG